MSWRGALSRDPAAKPHQLVARFLLKHLAVMFYSVGYLGYLTYIFTPNSGVLSPDTIFSYSMFVLLVVALRFHVSVLREYGLAGWRIRAVEAFYLLPLAEFVLALSGYMQAALKLNAMAVMLMPVAVFVLLLSSRQSAEVTRHNLVPTYLSKRTLLIYYGFIVMLLVAGATQIIGLVKGGQLVLHAFLFHSFISSILLMTMLQLRARQIQQRHLITSGEIARAQGELTAERLAREEQGRMVEMLSHEIKTPLSVLQFAIEEWIQEKRELQVADQSIQEIKSVVDRAIAASRNASSVEIFEFFDLGDVVREQIELTGAPERFNVSIDSPSLLNSNRLMVEQMVSNLVNNALKYGAKTSPIAMQVRPSARIQLELEQPSVVLSVVNAVGLAGQPDPEMVFKKYYRAEAAKSQAGTGVGLYLVQQFAKFLGGAIQYRPTQTSVEFVLWLPNNTSSL
jgi:signal transduction histidine kinase